MKHSEPDELGITDEARALAQAVLAGDSTSALALADWVVENQRRPVGRFSTVYVEQLEDALVEAKQIIHQSRLLINGGGKAVYRFNGDSIVTREAADRFARRLFNLELFAKGIGREGPV